MPNPSKKRAAALGLLVMIGCGDDGASPADARIDATPEYDGPPDEVLITFNVLTYDYQPEIGGDTVLISDNGGAWHPMTEAAGAYTAMIAGPRYAIARGCIDPGSFYTEAWLYYLHVDDATTLTDLGCHYSADPVQVGGQVIGVGPDHRGYIAMGSGLAFLSAGATDYALTTAAGPADLVARLMPNVPITEPRPTDRLLIERDVAVTPGLVHDLDFAADGFAPEEHTIDITGAGTASTEVVSSSLVSSYPYGFTLESSRGATNRYHAAPAARMRPTELVRVFRSSSEVDSYRSFTTYLAAPGAVTGAYPAAFAPAPPTIASVSPVVRLSGSLPHVADADLYTVSGLASDDATFDIFYWSQSYTARWAGDQPVDYTFPDLAGIGGWSVGLPAALAVDWNQSASGATQSTQLPTFGQAPVAGDVVLDAGTRGTLGP